MSGGDDEDSETAFSEFVSYSPIFLAATYTPRAIRDQLQAILYNFGILRFSLRCPALKFTIMNSFNLFNERVVRGIKQHPHHNVKTEHRKLKFCRSALLCIVDIPVIFL